MAAKETTAITKGTRGAGEATSQPPMPLCGACKAGKCTHTNRRNETAVVEPQAALVSETYTGRLAMIMFPVVTIMVELRVMLLVSQT